MKTRLDKALVEKGLLLSRSQAESYIRLGKVKVNDQVIKKTGWEVSEADSIKIESSERYVSRAGFKLASIAPQMNLDFRGKTVLDVGSSTGGFTDYALQNGASRVIAVDVGTNQLHPSLRNNPKIDLREQTDIRSIKKLGKQIEIVVIDVSFISIREVLAHLPLLITKNTEVIAMVKPQFEASQAGQKHKGVIKNDAMRRDILKNFEAWVLGKYKIEAKMDSEVKGEKGNKERFYKLRLLSN